MLKEKMPYIVAIVLILLALILMSFKAGTLVGFRRGTFGCQWGENYRENFGGGREDFFPQPMGMMNRQPRPHGLFGTVIKNDVSSLVMKDLNNNETIVLMNESTKVFNRDGEIGKEMLTPESSIVVIGRPNTKGQVEAKIIRLEDEGNNFEPNTPEATTTPDKK